MKSLKQPCQHLHTSQITAAHRNGALYIFFLFCQLFFCLVHQLQNLLCPAAEQNPFIGQYNLPGPPVKELYSHFFFQLRNLTAQGRLCDMQHIGSPGDALFPDH